MASRSEPSPRSPAIVLSIAIPSPPFAPRGAATSSPSRVPTCPWPSPSPSLPSVAALVTMAVLDKIIVRRQVHEAPSLLQSPRQLMVLP